MNAALKILLFLGVWTLCTIASPSEASAIGAKSCSRSDVGAAVDAAVDGDVVQIPAGTCSWTSTLVVSKNITLIGAGIDATIIQDDVVRTGDSSNTDGVIVNMAGSGTWRLTGMTFTYGALTTRNYNGSILVTGTSPSFRIDHIKIDNLYTSRQTWFKGGARGVVDHNTFYTTRQSFIAVIFHGTWGGVGNYGDNSWATPTDMGTQHSAIYFEDNTFTQGQSQILGAFDSVEGARFVVRNNTFQNASVETHGTETTGRPRGTRFVEVYGNTFTYSGPDWPAAVHYRSGSGVVFSNVFSGFGYAVTASNFRDTDRMPPWGVADGSSPYDRNDGVIYASGTHTGGTAMDMLVDSTKSFASNQWVGDEYSVRNMTRAWGSSITANTAKTITSAPAIDHGTGTVAHTWNTGDSYQILRARPAIDQVGRGQGDLLSGDLPLPMQWPNQALEPLYVWGNTLNGTGSKEVVTYAPRVKIGRDIVVGTAKPDYKPFVYPHPLVTGSQIAAPSSPSNLYVQ